MVAARYLLDTNALSEPPRPRPNPGLLDRLSEHREELATAAPVWHELLVGARRLAPSRRREELERYLASAVRDAMPILPYDGAAAEWHASERVRLGALGRTPAYVDGQIAAIAYVNKLILVTANVSDFADFAGLGVENWCS